MTLNEPRRQNSEKLNVPAADQAWEARTVGPTSDPSARVTRERDRQTDRQTE